MKNIVFILNALLFVTITQAQRWENIIGLPNRDDNSGRIVEHYDHGYLISGNFIDWSDIHHGWTVKTDINGEVLWDKQIGLSPDYVYIRLVRYDQQGNIYLFGLLLNQNFEHEYPLVVKLNACGEKQWCRMYALDSHDFGDFSDAIILDNGDLLCVAYMPDMDYDELIWVFRISSDGDLLWHNNYASLENHPYYANRSPRRINKFGDFYIITGYVYSPYPNGNPDHVYLRPMFIGIDEYFKEQWIVEFGISDSLLGKAESVVPINDTLFMGVGRYRFIENGIMDKKCWLMFFNDKGEEIGYKFLEDEQFGPEILESSLYQIEQIEGDKYLASAGYMFDEDGNYAKGEMVIDTAGNVYNWELYENTISGGGIYLVKTFDGKYTLTSSYELPGQTKSDIHLYKVNKNLEQDTLYPGKYTYDSLCPRTIESGIIDLAGCDIITSIGEIPTLEEYRQKLQNIGITASPNPSNTGEVLLEFENTEILPASPPLIPPGGGTGPSLIIFNMLGKKVHEERVYRFQGAARINVSGWPAGMYVATIFSNGQVKGKCKVLVK